jgi:S1-C subfamily serine protease
MTADGYVIPVERVLAANRRDDLAVLKVEREGLPPLPLADSGQATAVGSPVGLISHPGGHFYSYTSGVVSRYMKVPGRSGAFDAFSITADYARGSSGAPVLNDKGQVVGIVKSTESIYHSTNNSAPRHLQMVCRICIPVTSLKELLEN